MSGTKTNELEKLVNSANLAYRKNKEALILKVPVPILMTATGLVAQASTVDYTGTLNGGLSIAFDAKETKQPKSFPLKNIHEHQLLYLQIVRDLGGYAFFMIWFKEVHPIPFITPLSIVEKYWFGNGRHSIPLTDFKKDWLIDTANYINKVTEMKDELSCSKDT